MLQTGGRWRSLLIRRPWVDDGGGAPLCPTTHARHFRWGEEMAGWAFRGITAVLCSGSSNFDRRRAFTRSSPTGQRMSTRHRSSTPRTSHQPYPSPKPTERHRRCTSGDPAYLEDEVTPRSICCCCSGYAAARPPSADPSAFGGLLCFCPSGHSYGAHMGALKVATKVCRRP